MSISAEIQISDSHVGHKTAIMYPQNDVDYVPNKAQRWLFKTFSQEFLPDVERLLDKYKPDYVHLSALGDMGELDYKRRNQNEVWTSNADEIDRNMANLFEPLVNLADSMHVVRGTKAHVGEDGGIDEKFARDWDNIVPATKTIYAGWYAEFVLSGVHFEIAHHGANRSRWTDTNGLNALGNEILLKRTKNGQRCPDVVSRGHFHYSGHTASDNKPYVIAVPSWQLPTTYVYRVDRTVETPHVGGHVVIVEDGRIIETARLKYQFPRKKPICLQK